MKHTNDNGTKNSEYACVIWYPCPKTYRSKYDSDVRDVFELYTRLIGAHTIRALLYEHIFHHNNDELLARAFNWGGWFE